MDKKKLKKVIVGSLAVLGAAYGVLSVVAKHKKGSTVYDGEDDQKNPLEGKRVEFVEDENDPENADGVRGHLVAVGDSEQVGGVYNRYIKRAIDKALSFCGLVALSPVYAAIAIAIKIDDPGPVLFTQKRLGENKRYFKLHKFRSMKMCTPHDVPTHMLDDPDQYITRVGKFLRKSSLDELPQIWDIFVGNMSIIGPRPGLWNQDLLTAERDKYGANDVKPGLTGLAQISGRDELEIPVKAKLDGEYVKKQSFFFDMKCFFGTIKSVLKHDGVVEGGTGEMKKANSEKKKILVICQYYKPEPFRVSDICEELASHGNEVHVVTGYPNYPEGVLYNGYGRKKHIDEVVNGVYVHRSFTIPRASGVIRRFMNYYSYAFSSTRYILSRKCCTLDNKKFDVVLCNQLSPVMMAYAAIAYKKKYKVPFVLYCLDLWPASLCAGGVKEDSLIFKVFHKISANIYRNADKILVTSRSFNDYLCDELGISLTKIDYLPQYAESLFEPIDTKETSDVFNFMFAGNIGEIQSVETIIYAAAILKTYPVKFHIVGSGTDLERLKVTSQKLNLNNVIFYGRRPVEDMPKLYAIADAMLVTLADDSVLSLTLPGKVQSYMAAAKPVIGAINGETKSVIEASGCGYCGAAGDFETLAKNIVTFIDPNTNRKQLGLNARKYYEEHFSKNIFMKKMEKELDL